MSPDTGTPIQRCLDRLRAGDAAARDELLRLSRHRLLVITRKMLHGFPGVRRWEEPEDILHNVFFRLDRCLSEVPLDSPRAFLALAATHIRRELLDLARHYFGPQGHGANYATPQAGRLEGEDEPLADGSNDPARLAAWTDLHTQVAALPDNERETFELVWYHGMTREEAAAVLGVDVRTVKRYWQTARLLLAEALGGEPPG